jgi:hypothetical protein
MIPNEIGQKLHDRATRAEALAALQRLLAARTAGQPA